MELNTYTAYYLRFAGEFDCGPSPSRAGTRCGLLPLWFGFEVELLQLNSKLSRSRNLFVEKDEYEWMTKEAYGPETREWRLDELPVVSKQRPAPML